MRQKTSQPTRSIIDETLHPREIPLERKVDLGQQYKARLANIEENYHDF